MSASDAALSVKARLKRDSFTLDVAFESDAALTALFGPSGSGKTTVLNAIAGVTRLDDSRICVAGDILEDTASRVFVAPYKRRVGFVFQDAQLFPHLTVDQNIKFGRWFRSRASGDLPVDVVVDVLAIADLLNRRPATLSGGEKHRVAIARALLSSPRILLMDEPLAGLDDMRRNEIMTFIERVRDEFSVPIVYVTHNRDEVRRLASRVVCITSGRVVAAGTPSETLGEDRY
jgi:molybdate transport system ATP-binding protein